MRTRLGTVAALLAPCALAPWASGCAPSGQLDLELSLPQNADLRPQGAATITVLAQSPAMDPIANVAVIGSNNTFTAGDLPVGKDVSIDVLLHDVDNRLVGVGEAPTLVNIAGDTTTKLGLPVRRPFVYAASGSALYTYDPSLAPSDAKFQGTLAVSAPQLAISVGGDRLVVASTTQLQIVDTATHTVTGSPISIGGMIADAAAVPGRHQVAVGHTQGISLVDLDTGAVTNISGPAVDKITVGPGPGGGLTAFGLVASVAPPVGPVDSCSGQSSLVQTPIDSPPQSVQAMPLNAAVADIAAAPNTSALFAALPCDNKVKRIDAELSKDVSMLERAAVVTVAGGRVWAAGSHASVPVCVNSSNQVVTCTPAAPAQCPAGTANVAILYVSQGANLILQSIPIGTGDPITFAVPELRENMIDTTDEAGQHAQELHAMGFQPLDIVALPGGQYVSVVTSNSYYIAETVDQFNGTILLPCLYATTGDWLLLDMASSSVASRVRTDCKLTTGPTSAQTPFPTWMCDSPPAGEAPMAGSYTPVSVGALFGAR